MKLLFIILLFIVSSQQEPIRCKLKYLRTFKHNDKIFRRNVSFWREKPHLVDLHDGEKRAIYYYEQTLVVRDSTIYNEIQRCEVMYVANETELYGLSQALFESYTLVVQQVDMRTMMLLLRECDSVDASVADEGNHETVGVLGTIKNVFIHQIVPGTKWCGAGNVATSYHDLGLFSRVDRCCRAHDNCPISIMSGEERYSLMNYGRYTISHCLCDETFYDCLKSYDAASAEVIGNFYFREYLPDCIKGFPNYPGQKMEIVPATKHW